MTHINTFGLESHLENEMLTLVRENLDLLLEEDENSLALLPMANREEAFLIFTEFRIIYLMVSDFLKNQRFYSYPYETAKSLMIKKRTSKPSDSDGILWFLIDYTSGEIIFAEIFSSDSIDFIKKQMSAIPLFNETPKVTKIYGSRKFDRIIHDPELALDNKGRRNMAFILIAIILVIALVARSL